MMGLYPYIHTPVVQLGVIVGAVATVIRATKLEQIRENDEAPRIIVDGIIDTAPRELRKPKRHWFWIKLSCVSAIVSIIAISLFAWRHHHASHQSTVTPRAHVTPPEVAPKPQTAATPAPAVQHKPVPPLRPGPQLSSQQSTPDKSAKSQPQPASPLPPAKPEPPAGPDSPAICPKGGGSLAGQWDIGTSPMAMNGYNFTYALNQAALTSLNPYLRQLLNARPPHLTSAQLISVISFMDELASHIPKQNPVRINGISVTPEVAVVSASRPFQGDSIQVGYSLTLPNNLEASPNRGSISIPINSLSANELKSISDLDNLVRASADSSCRDALRRLTAPQ